MDNPDEKWQSLLRHSGPTFEAVSTPPYGFVTSTLARLSAEKRLQAEAERIGWRALLASFAALVVAAVVTLSVTSGDRSSEFDPGVRSLVALDNIQIS